MHVRHQDAQDDKAVLQARVVYLEHKARYLRTGVVTIDERSTYTRDAWNLAMDRIREMQIEIKDLQQQRQDDVDRATRLMGRIKDLEDAKEPEHHDRSPNTSSSCLTSHVADALATMKANRSTSQEATNRTTTTTCTCSYKEFHSCMQGNFSRFEGAVGLTRWFKKLVSVFQVSKVEDGDRVKYAACIMLDGALTWWNSYIRSVGIHAANATPWSEFKQMLIKKYYPRSEVQKIEVEPWNLKIKGINIAYTQHFQELALLYETRMIKCYIGGLSQNIKVNVTLSKPIDIHKTITMAQSLMDQVVQDLGQLTSVSILETYPTTPEQRIKETKTTRGTHLPVMVVDKKGIIRMNVQKQGTKAEETRSEATRIVGTRTRTKETEMEETMARETRMEMELVVESTG
ncbi:hypothetical protein Tco_1275290 [Tanacetum coccineum]